MRARWTRSGMWWQNTIPGPWLMGALRGIIGESMITLVAQGLLVMPLTSLNL